MKTLKEWAEAHGVTFVGRSAGVYTTGTVSAGALEELFAAADALRRERDTAFDTLTRDGWEYIPYGICGPVWKPPVNVAMAKMRRERDEARGERDELARRNAELAARLAEIERAEPVRGVVLQDGEATLVQRGTELLRVRHCGASRLYTRPAPAAAPERAEPDHCEDATMSAAQRDGGAMLSSGSGYTIKLLAPVAWAHPDGSVIYASTMSAAPEWADPTDAELVAAEWPEGFEQAVQSLPTLADAVALFDAPEQAEPGHLEDARGMACAVSGLVGRDRVVCDHSRSAGEVCVSPRECVYQRPRPCHCGPDGCPDRVSCPKGGAA